MFKTHKKKVLISNNSNYYNHKLPKDNQYMSHSLKINNRSIRANFKARIRKIIAKLALKA